jgi:acyl-CoA synthetase (NDP forming)/bacterioferritin-associated ferredoxin
VPAVIIPGGGVVEGGAAAAAMQAEVAAIAREHGLALVGPNCMGVIDLTTNTSAYIGDVSPYLPRGGVAGIAQSGSVTDAFVHSGTRVGFSRIIGCGSEVSIDLCDYLAFCLDDPQTTSIILFVEGFRRPERFLALADHALRIGKPIMAVKVGRSQQAQAATIAHSGSLAGEARVSDAALDAVGVIRCRDLDQLLETAELVEGMRRTGRGIGRGRTGVVTVSTGEASLIADMAPGTGVDLPPIPAVTEKAILDGLPTMGYIGNPLDPWGAADASTAYNVCFEAMAASGAYDVLAIVHDFPYRSLPSEVATANEVTRQLLAATADRPDLLPVYVSLTSGEPPPDTKRVLDEEGGGAPLLRGASEAFTAIAGVARWTERHDQRAGQDPRRAEWQGLAADRTPYALDAVTSGRTASGVALSEADSLERLESAGLPVTPFRRAATAEGAAVVADDLGFPVVIKLDAEGVAHKTDIGGVQLAIGSREAARAAAARLLALQLPAGARRRGLVVQPLAPAGVELILGMRRDSLFGPTVLVGLGGILTEVLDDVAIRLAPVGREEAVDMLRDLRGQAVLDGTRGRPGVSLNAVADIIVRLGAIAVGDPEAGPLLVGLMDRRERLPANPIDIFCSPDAYAGGGADADPEVCNCNRVSRSAILGAIDDGCATVADIKRETHAGTGCGSCVSTLAALLDRHAPDGEEEGSAAWPRPRHRAESAA